MEYCTLGRTGLRVSRVGLGTGGPSRLGQRQGLSEAESHQVVHRALDLGINLFDTSPRYGDSERILGRALQNAKAAARVHICTKVSPYRVIDGQKVHDSVADPEQVISSVERSLKRLGVEVLDIVLLHGVSPASFQQVIDRVYPVLARLRDQGKIRFIGISELAWLDGRQATVPQALQTGLFDVIMLRYGMFVQGAERRVFSRVTRPGSGFMGMSPVRPPFCRPAELKKWIEALKADGKLGRQALSEGDPVARWIEEGSAALAAAGMKFAANQRGIHAVMTGTANLDHLEANVRAALGPPLPSAVEATLRDIYGRLDETRAGR